ncbi:unnamed protein product, partial [Musa textilis]
HRQQLPLIFVKSLLRSTTDLKPSSLTFIHYHLSLKLHQIASPNSTQNSHKTSLSRSRHPPI